MKKALLRISVYDFDSYQEFLKAAYEDLHSQDPNFSYRYIQKKAGYGASSNHFWQKANGISSLGETSALRYAKALGLNARETQFFVTLVAMNEAKTDEARAMYVEQLKSSRRYRIEKKIGRLRAELYSAWYLPALRSVVTLKDFREDYRWIGKRLSPPITPKQARDGINKLLEIGYLMRDKSGKLQQTEPFMGDYNDRSGDSPVAKLAIRNYHRFMIGLAADSLESQTQEQRYIIGNTMAVSRAQVHRLREAAREFMGKVESIVAEDEPIEVLYRMNVQFFSLVSGDTQETTDASREHPARKDAAKRGKKAGSK